MTLRRIQWIADSGLLVGLTTIGEFAAAPALAPLSLSSSAFTLAMPESGAILGATAGSAITASGLPAGLTTNASPGWAYDGTGMVGSYTILLTETLAGAGNSPLTTSITVTVSAPAAGMLDFSQSANSGLIAALRSF
jgi:hypothetical protein